MQILPFLVSDRSGCVDEEDLESGLECLCDALAAVHFIFGLSLSVVITRWDQCRSAFGLLL